MSIYLCWIDNSPRARPTSPFRSAHHGLAELRIILCRMPGSISRIHLVAVPLTTFVKTPRGFIYPRSLAFASAHPYQISCQSCVTSRCHQRRRSDWGVIKKPAPAPMTSFCSACFSHSGSADPQNTTTGTTFLGKADAIQLKDESGWRSSANPRKARLDEKDVAVVCPFVRKTFQSAFPYSSIVPSARA